MAKAQPASDDLGEKSTTPVMAQYLSLRQQAGEALLFFRMGDFYELFFEDAKVAAQALDIALTSRGQHQGQDIPMCGVPVHSVEVYLNRLIRKGFKIAIAEQLEDPAQARKRGSKAVVARDIVRIITPGTLTDDPLLDAQNANYLASIAQVHARWAVAWAELSTGQFCVQALEEAGEPSIALESVLARIQPAEVLITSATLAALPDGFLKNTYPISLVDAEAATSMAGVESLSSLLQGPPEALAVRYSRAELAAAGMVLHYIKNTQRQAPPNLALLVQEDAQSFMAIDAMTRKSLELTHANNAERRFSLLGQLDATLTAAGARLLSQQLGTPLLQVPAIEARLDLVQFFLDDSLARTRLRALLIATPDIERALTRLALNRATPRDLGVLRNALVQAVRLKALLRSLVEQALAPPPNVQSLVQGYGEHANLAELLTQALAEPLPLDFSQGCVIANRYDAALDSLRAASQDGRQRLAALEARLRQETAVASLKIRHNALIGYHIEVTNKHADVLLAPSQAGRFIHRQTMVGAVRFTTHELVELAQEISQSAERAIALEKQHFAELCTQVLGEQAEILRTAKAIAHTDVACALAQKAANNQWVRPKVDASKTFFIEGGRHLVVESALSAQKQSFVPNDCDLGPTQPLWLITGPNMAGKSTYLRQNALIAILAQMGSFVPAKRAHIGVIDKLFSRVGAADDLSQGRSTFMVEMVETATILRDATPRSLVILDEVGRGTATYDGLAIAWAVLEQLHSITQARCLFATHYHELTQLKSRLDKLYLATVKVRVWQESLVFLHEIAPGLTDRSYGLQVAKMAGLPSPVLNRAEALLKQFEAQGLLKQKITLEALPLFAQATQEAPSTASTQQTAISAPHAQALALLSTLKPDDMRPKEALDILYQLVTLAQEGAIK
jgi:DNA mismatch repair protein MutS